LRALRVLHCPLNVAGHPAGLAAAERSLGLASTAVALEPSPYGFTADEVLFAPDTPQAVRDWRRLRLLRRALREVDVVHFNFGQTLSPEPLPPPTDPRHPALAYRIHALYARALEQRDLPLLRHAGKAIFVTFQGDDARQADFCLRTFEWSTAAEAPPGYYTPESDARKRRRIATFGRYAHGIFALNPDLLHVLPRQAEFLPYAHVDLSDWRPPGAPTPGDRPLVVHAPTWRGGKGTRYVLDAVDRLRAEGLDFDFQLVEGLRHDEARRLYERADLAIDQLLAGWYGGFALEMMALGKPVVAYLREGDLGFVAEEQRADLPVVSANPATVTDVLRDLLARGKGGLARLGERSRGYAERWHDSRAIATRLQRAYERVLSR
jgi:glycosyltransferase involved in cell wall biosynthesis